METSYRKLDYESGRGIQTLRYKTGLTQARLAEHLGVSGRTVSEWEAGGSYPKAERLRALIALAVQYRAFPKGSEAEEIRVLWETTRQKRLLDEDWLSALLSQGSCTDPDVGQGPDRGQTGAGQGQALSDPIRRLPLRVLGVARAGRARV